jgi:hypothetical protein
LESDGKAKYEVRYCCAVYSTHSQLLETGLPLEFPNTCELKVNDVIINNNVSWFEFGKKWRVLI